MIQIHEAFKFFSLSYIIKRVHFIDNTIPIYLLNLLHYYIIIGHSLEYIYIIFFILTFGIIICMEIRNIDLNYTFIKLEFSLSKHTLSAYSCINSGIMYI